MIKLIGETLVLFLLHKLDKYIGTENVLKYLGAWAYARKNKIVKIPMPEAMVIKLKKDLETFGAKVLDNGVILLANGRYLDSKAFLEANTSQPGVGLTNILLWKTSLENKYPGLLDKLQEAYRPETEKMSIEKLSSLLDDISDQLEDKGLVKEAYAVDVVSNTMDIFLKESKMRLLKKSYNGQHEHIG